MTPWEVPERGFDLADLHPVAAHFDLFVQASEKLDRPVIVPAGEIAGPVKPRPRLVPQGSGTKRSAVKSGCPR